MKNYYLLSILLCCGYMSLSAQFEGNTYVFQSESPRSNEVCITHNLKPELSQRAIRSRGTVFNIIYDNPADWNAGQERAIEYAAKLWEEQIMTCYPRINLRVKFQNLGSSLARTNVRYYSNRNWYRGEDNVMTGALLKNWQIDAPEYLMNMGQDSLKQYIDTDDITIIFNNEEDIFYWGTDGNTPANKYDFVTVAIREIAKGLEIGSTILGRGNVFTAYLEGLSTNFDLLMGLNSYNLPSRSQALANAAQDGRNRTVTFYNGNSNKTLEFYVPSVYEPYVSFNYLTEKSAIANGAEFLSVNLPMGASFHKISTTIGEFLDRKLGWEKPVPIGTEPGWMQSASTELIDFDQGMSFEANTLMALGPRQVLPQSNNSIRVRSIEERDYYSNYYYPQGLNYEGTETEEWRLDLLRTDGKFITVKRQTSFTPTFQVTPSDIPDNENWARNSDGYLRARIYYRSLGGSAINPVSYLYNYIFLDYYPQQPKLSAFTKTNSTTRNINRFPELMLGYKAWGATSVKLVHESEDGIVNYTFYPDEDFIDMSNVDPYIENTFTLTAINKNGQKKSDVVKWGGEDFMRAYYTFSRQLKSVVEDSHTLILELQTCNGQGSLIEEPSLQGTIKKYRIIKINNPLVHLSGVANDCRVGITTWQLQSGVYMVQVIDNEGMSYTTKFIKK